MIRRRPITTIILLILIISGSIAAMIWGNLQYTRTYPGGEQFLVDWFSARSLFIDGVNPYSETAQNSLIGFAAAEGISLPVGARFGSPLYAAYFTLPFAVISDYPLARALWMVLLEGLLVALVFMSLNLARWKIKPVYLALIAVFALLWFHGLYPLLSGNNSILVSLFIAAIFLAVRDRQYEFAGVLLGFTTIQPHAIALFAVFVVVWSLRNRHAKLAGWFFATVILLAATGALIRPQWFVDYLRVIIQPSEVVPTIRIVLQSFLPAAGQRLGIILSALTGIILFFEWFVSKKTDFDGFFWTGLLTWTLAPWIGLPTHPSVFLTAFPAIILAICLWNERWPRAGLVLSITALLLLFGGIWLIYFAKAGLTASAIPGLFFAHPLIVGIMLYWVRWWAIRKPNVWFDSFSQQ